MRHPLAACALWLCTSALHAQKLPIGPDDPRVLQLHSLPPVGHAPQDDEQVDGQPDGQPARAAAQRRTRLDRIAALARAFVEPPLEPSEGIEALSDRHIALLGRPQQQAWLERYVHHLDEAADRSRIVNVRVLRLPAAAADRLDDLRLRGTEDDRWTTLPRDGSELAGWLTAVRGRGAEIVQAPMFLAHDLQEVTLQVGVTRPFVSAHAVVTSDGEPAISPVAEQVFDGVTVHATWTSLGDGSIGLDVRCERNELRTPPTIHGATPGGTPLELDLHRVLRTTAAQRLRLGKAEAGIIVGPPVDGERTVLIVDTDPVR